MDSWSVNQNILLFNNSVCEGYSESKIYEYFSDETNPRPLQCKNTFFDKFLWNLKIYLKHHPNNDSIDNDYSIEILASRPGIEFFVSVEMLEKTDSWFDPDYHEHHPVRADQRNHLLEVIKECKIKKLGVVDSETFFLFRKKLDYEMFEESHIKDDDLKNHNIIKTVEREHPLNLRSITRDGDEINLYDYQKVGLSWLRYLDVSETGGVLADEMGLGKTLQVISLICDPEYRNRPCGDKKIKKPSLIIVRSSLVENWMREFDKFSKGLKILRNSGPDRIKFRSELEKYDVIISTYDCVVNDITILEDCEWNGLILDEAHRIKNPDSQRFEYLDRLKARIRICITGTPVQNHLLDMWSLGSFVNPNGFGPRDEWESGDMPRDEAEENFSAIKLRREVDTVMDSLPELIKLDTPLVMPFEEREQYDNIRSQVREEYGQAAGLIQVTPLRQFCAHPQSLNENYYCYLRQSVKYSRLIDLVNEIKFTKQKAVIFSSYNRLSEIIRNDIARENSTFCDLINGSVKADERQPIIDRWGDHDGPGFIIANPDAAGEGLNMTQGQHVIHFTLEWNPAKQEQATKRVHRIGQKLPVRVHRLYYIDTIEEIQINVLNERIEMRDEVITESIFNHLNQAS